MYLCTVQIFIKNSINKKRNEEKIDFNWDCLVVLGVAFVSCNDTETDECAVFYTIDEPCDWINELTNNYRL